MDEKPSRKQRWRLNKEALDILFAKLDPDREIAGENYIVLQTRLVRFFEYNNCQHPEAHAIETLNRAAKKLSEGNTIDNLTPYCFGIARKLLLEIYRIQEKEREALNQLPPPEQEPDDPSDQKARLECFDTSMNRLGPEDRELIIRYYDDGEFSNIENRKRLADELGIPLNALRIRAHRIRLKLEQWIDECLEKLER